jgi:hypothetical protein
MAESKASGSDRHGLKEEEGMGKACAALSVLEKGVTEANYTIQACLAVQMDKRERSMLNQVTRWSFDAYFGYSSLILPELLSVLLQPGCAPRDLP